jgi:hypothetical protein
MGSVQIPARPGPLEIDTALQEMDPYLRRESKLRESKEKRHFPKNTKPTGKMGRKGGESFVVQEFHARRHHFAFLPEIDGVLGIWAVPKGIPDRGPPASNKSVSRARFRKGITGPGASTRQDFHGVHAPILR